MSVNDDLRSRLEKAGLGAISNELINQSREAVRMISAPASDSTLPVGASKLGGWPDLPQDLKWPEWKSNDLSFVAQINLAELSETDMLPGSGVLSFFYDREQRAWGYDPKHKDGFRLWYFPEISGLSRRQPPDGSQFPSARLEFVPFLSLPDSSVLGDRILELEDDEIYYLFCRGYFPQPRHQIFGWPWIIQNPMELNCQLASNGIYVGNASGYQDPRRKELEAGAGDWMLLLQIDSDEKTKMMWGDAGTLYAWIRYPDLKKGDFDKAWTILQCF